MLYQKSKLLEIAKPYFEDSSIQKLFVTEDGNVFYDKHKNYAEAHRSRCKVKLFTITREDYIGKKITSKPTPVSVNEELSLREQAKALGISNIPGRTSDEAIQKMIDEHKAKSNAGK